MIWIVAAILSFAAGQLYLLYCLRKFDRLMQNGRKDEAGFSYDDDYRYLWEDVIQ